MLIHRLQGFQGSQILIPARRDLEPDWAFLAERYEIFRKTVESVSSGGISHLTHFPHRYILPS